MANLSPIPKLQFFGTDGKFLVGGKLYSYQAGTTTPLPTYTSSAGTIQNTNPVVLGTQGEAEVWLGEGIYKLKLTDASGVELWTVDNVNGNTALSGPNGSNLIGFIAAGANAVARTVQSKLRDVVSVTDFGADPTGTTDSTAAINNAINAAAAIYIPQGTYLISGPINVGTSGTLGNKRIYGDGFRTTVLKATSSTATIQNKSSHYWIELRDFQFNGDDVASVGISLGNPSGSTGSAAYDYLNNVYVTSCVDSAIELNWLQYTQIEQCFFGGTSQGYGMLANRFLTSVVTNTTIIDNKYGFKVDHCSDVNFNYVNLYGPYGSTVPAWYLVIVDSYNVFLNHVTFENEQTFVNPLVIVSSVDGSAITGNIWFNQCLWLGLAYNQNLIELQAGIRIFFQDCRAIHPSAGKYVLQNTAATEVYINDCFLGNSYFDYPTQYWTDGWVNGTVVENRSTNTPLTHDYTNNRVGINNTAPSYGFDHVQPSPATGIIARHSGGTYNQVNLAPSFQVKVETTTSNANRGLQVNLNGTTINLYPIGWTGSAYDPVGDGAIDIGYDTSTVQTGKFKPRTDNTYPLGNASYRWSEVFAATGTINTSDAREKEVRQEGIDEAVLRAWGKVNYSQFKFKDAIEKKGDGARWHFGLMAQQVKEAFESEGLDAFAYGLLCYDEWADEYEMIGDGEGNFVKGEKIIKPAGNRYGIRYEEALALECAYLRSKVK